MSEKYHFTKVVRKKQHSVEADGVLQMLNGYLLIGRDIRQGLGDPPRIEIELDNAMGAIKLTASTGTTGYSLSDTTHKRTVRLNIPALRKMGLLDGRYDPVGGGVFVHESRNK